MGANYVIAQGMPPIGCLAFSMKMYKTTNRDKIGCVGSVNDLSNIHNTIFQQNLRGLLRQFPGIVIDYADYNNAYSYVLKNGGLYGINHMFKACCGAWPGEYNFNILAHCGSFFSDSCKDPSRYINWYGLHLTEAMYKAISKEFFTKTAIFQSFRHL
ncbi:GDSL esterase/lipase At3g48460-like [Apium graveolens]|uniref:GDSL esterase/lipase At3g48460-like n=1 Tax=Apium graveolens TaxID=4045 RepID=UPI003D792E6A